MSSIIKWAAHKKSAVKATQAAETSITQNLDDRRPNICTVNCTTVVTSIQHHFHLKPWFAHNWVMCKQTDFPLNNLDQSQLIAGGILTVDRKVKKMLNLKWYSFLIKLKFNETVNAHTLWTHILQQRYANSCTQKNTDTVHTHRDTYWHEHTHPERLALYTLCDNPLWGT